MSSSVCRVCLCSITKGHRIENTYLRETYEKFAGSKVPTYLLHILWCKPCKVVKIYKYNNKVVKILKENVKSKSLEIETVSTRTE